MYKIKIWYRGFNPHESGPSHCNVYSGADEAECMDILNTFENCVHDHVVLKWEIWKEHRELVRSG